MFGFVLQRVQLSIMDHCWHKIRKAVTSISFPKSSGGNGGQGGAADGLLKLRDDVKMCGYRDVEVMWNMLSTNQQAQQMEAKEGGKVKASATKTRPPKRSSKQKAIWRLFSWTDNHNA